MNATTAWGSRGLRRVLFSLLCSWALLALAPTARASTATADDAHRALAEGRYGEAEPAFEAVIRERGYSAPLLYDLGNAYLRDGKPAPALLAYERARLLAPRDEAIATNLASARAALGVPVERSAIDRFARSLSMSTWAWVTAGAFWLSLTLGGAGLLSKRRRFRWSAGAALALAGAAVSGSALYIASRELDRGLVMAATPVLVSPFESAQSAFSLAPGEDVDLGRSRGDYVFVHDGRGRSGWVARVQVAPADPGLFLKGE